MNAELIALAVLTAPGTVFGAVTLTGHALTRRRDARLAAVLAATPRGGPKPPGDPQLVPEDSEAPTDLAAVVDLAQHRRTRTTPAATDLPQEEAS